MNIIIEKILHVNKGGLRAFVDLQLDGIQIKDCRLVQQGDQKPWLSMPQKSWTTQAGQTKYISIITLPKTLHETVQKVAVTSWEASNV